MSRSDIFEGDGKRNLVIPTDSIPPAAWQAIYYHLSKKVETSRQLYTGAFEIKKEDIVDLIHRIEQAAIGYGPQAEKLEFEIDFRDDGSQRLTSLEKYLAIDFSHKRCCTKRVAIDYDFILSPSTELSIDQNPAQKFKVFIIIDQDFFSGDDPEQAGFFNDGIAGKNILTLIEYSDYAVSRSLHAAIEDWVSALPKRKVPFILRVLPKVLKSFYGALPAFGAAAVAIPFIRFSAVVSAIDLVSVILFAICAMTSSFGLLSAFVPWSLDTIAKLQPTSYLLLTAGDAERKLKIQSEGRSRIALFSFIFSTVIVGFLVGTLSSLFADLIG